MTDTKPPSHWFEDKAGLCLELGGRRDDVAASPDAVDPCPQAPGILMNIERVETLTREIGRKAAEKAALSGTGENLTDMPPVVDGSPDRHDRRWSDQSQRCSDTARSSRTSQFEMNN